MAVCFNDEVWLDVLFYHRACHAGEPTEERLRGRASGARTLYAAVSSHAGAPGASALLEAALGLSELLAAARAAAEARPPSERAVAAGGDVAVEIR